VSFYVVLFLTGLANAASLSLIAAGLSVIFGVSRIVNFAHGSLFMLGAYIAHTLYHAGSGGIVGFWLAVIGAGLAVGALGMVAEALILRRLYRSPELMHLVATFGLVLLIQDLTLALWGPDDLLGPRVPGLAGSVEILGGKLPEYDLLLIVLGPAVLALLWLLLKRTRWGILVRAASEDREMADALGVNERWLFTSVFFVGAFLAGAGGALQLPREPANLLMDLNIIAEAFVVVVIGGMGSIGGAFLAAVLIAELQAFGILVFPEITLVIVFLVMAVALVIRPWGLFGRPQRPGETPGAEAEAEALLPPASRRLAAAAGLIVLVALPAATGDYVLKVMSEVFVFAIFAVSLHFLVGVGGMISFGQAAYLGVGAYAAALLVHHLDAPMALALLAAPIAGGAGALLFGWFCVRLSGVYLAMLTLAFAQLVWSAAFQWYEFTGGDNGIVGVWPAAWASDATVFYYLALAAAAAAIWLVRRISRSPIGYAVRACRDSPQRSEAIGIPRQRFQWLAFTLSGAVAGLGGGLYAFLKGSVFPDVLSIPVSVDGLVMLLIGGVQTVAGAVLGSAAFVGLKVVLISGTDHWRAVLGMIIVGLVLWFPAGVAGTLGRWRRAGG
jgi:branched-chain amino acid transport system permease protein